MRKTQKGQSQDGERTDQQGDESDQEKVGGKRLKTGLGADNVK